uniref:t-SNARE coiled-coil homology domain-containing protein n=1 Tax=Steinernema glaseri TaxID=37863 RepID=A0A1I7Z5M7_9BILA
MSRRETTLAIQSYLSYTFVNHGALAMQLQQSQPQIRVHDTSDHIGRNKTTLWSNVQLQSDSMKAGKLSILAINENRAIDIKSVTNTLKVEMVDEDVQHVQHI